MFIQQRRNVSQVTRQGFTLIELLVVIAIISILASILFPVFARARENARRASCMSNMKQIALGCIMYSQDFDGNLFPYKYWGTGTSEMEVLQPYIKNTQIFRCPSSDQNYKSPANCDADPTHFYCTSYGFPYVAASDPYLAALMNINWGGSVTILDAVPEPSRTCLLAEVMAGSPSAPSTHGWPKFSARSATLTSTSPAAFVVTDRHMEGANYAFIDGHVKWLKKETALIPHAQNEAIKFYWEK